MEGDIDSAHVYARINERYCAMQGWRDQFLHIPRAERLQAHGNTGSD